MRLSVLLIGLLLATACSDSASNAAREGGTGGCRDPGFAWAAGDPPVNRAHIFCGEIDGDGQGKGVHSRALLATSPVVESVGSPRNERAGLYDADVVFRNGDRKFSTFFPDSCSTPQILASVRHAARNSSGRHPAWGILGPSAPAAGAEGYCLDRQGRPFRIRLGLLRDGRVNTAFPDR